MAGAALLIGVTPAGDPGFAADVAGWIRLAGVFTLGPLPLVLAERHRATVSPR
jgi:hypothetical protein